MKRCLVKPGYQYNDLMVLAESPNRGPHGDIYYHCQCKCGEVCRVRGSDIFHDRQKSCGCRRHQPTHFLPPGVAGLNALYRGYQRAARVTKRMFRLSRDDFQRITSADCAYCGAPPTQVKRSRGNSGVKPYFYNGLDRRDNCKGYHLKNVVPCCGRCNRMKGTLSTHEFLSHIKSIVKYHDKLFK
jgi:hypothetical protein